MLGKRVNNFEIVRLLGQGGMGSVYEAEHLLIKKKVAVKVLKPELGQDADLLQRFFNEARATSAIRHPNIVEVGDLGFLPDGMPYLVMELLEGESLGARLGRTGSLELATALDFATQTASALQAAHDNGIIHRDLKPDNLYLVRDQRFAGRELVKVLDFGIAKLHGDAAASPVDTVAGTIWGTPPYMSPEQCRGLPSQIDHRTDIYALGVILYEALSGRPPFVGEGVGDVIMMHMSVDPAPLVEHVPSLPAHVSQAIMRALAKKPEARFGSMAEFSAALRGADAPVVALTGHGDKHASVVTANIAGARGSAAPLGSFSARPPAGARALAASGARLQPALAHAPTEPGVDPEHEVTRRQSKENRDPAPLAPHPIAPAAATQIEVAPAFSHQKPARRYGQVAVTLTLVAALALFGLARFRTHPRDPTATTTHAIHGTPSSVPPGPTNAPLPLPLPESASVPAPLHPEPTKLTPKARHITSSAATTSKPSATPAAAPRPALPPAAAAPSASANVTAATNADSSSSAPAPPNLAPGYLSLDSEPWANVSIGAKQLGSTPLMRVALAPGKYVLTLTNPELGASTSYTVEVKSGTTVSRLVAWHKQ